MMSSDESTLPTDFTSPSMASAGVIITPKPVMTLMSVIFSTVASTPDCCDRLFGVVLELLALGTTGPQNLYELHITLLTRLRKPHPSL